MRKSTIAAAVMAVAVAAQAAAQGSAGSAALRPLPTRGETVLVAGGYGTTEFQPSFAFSTGGGWRVEHDARNDVFFFHGSPCCGQHADASTGFLFFMQPAKVYDVKRDVPVSAPADLAAWLRANPHLKVGPASPVTIAGASGEKFTASFRSGTKNGGGCADLVPSASESFGPMSLCPGDKALFAVIQVDGKSVLVIRQTEPAGGLGVFLPWAQTFLDTVRFDPGSTRAAAPKTLVVGSADPSYDDEIYFAQKVAQLSHGTLQVALQSDLYGGAPNNEQLVVRDLERGKLDLAWDPTRVWDKKGVTSYEGLQAPFLIDSLPLFRRVLTSPIAREVASGTLKVGVRGLALTAVDLRRPLGAKKPFVSPADFGGASINVVASRISEETMSALGATPVVLGGGVHDDLANGKVDAAETAIDVAFENGYGDAAHYMTSNLVFYPKPLSIDVNKTVFAGLTPAERRDLQAAATATARKSIELLDSQQNADAAAICKGGIKFARATPSALVALEAAVQPVYRTLSENPLTGRVISQIEALKRSTPAGGSLSIPAGCLVES